MYNKQVQIAPGVCLVYTMSTAVIVPEKDTDCTQWISFNGDNEPILNTSPDVECDTFLRRLQRARVIDQCGNTELPSGKQFCFEPMVDKRYNRWKRRRKKKHTESKKTGQTQAGDSSEENEERNDAVENIIDKMYAEIHGPPPQTPNGSHDTPRMRNRRRREGKSDIQQTSVIDSNSESIAADFDESMTWLFTDSRVKASSETEKDEYKNMMLPESGFRMLPQTEKDENDVCLYTGSRIRTSPQTERDENTAWLSTERRNRASSHTEQNGEELEPLVRFHIGPEKPEIDAIESVSDEMCSWPYLEQYKQEILKRLKDTPHEQLEELGSNQWLPDINTKDDFADDQTLNEQTGDESYYTGFEKRRDELNSDLANDIGDHETDQDGCRDDGRCGNDDAEDTNKTGDVEKLSEVSYTEEFQIRIKRSGSKCGLSDESRDFGQPSMDLHSRQSFLYNKWYKAQTADNKKMQPRLLSRSSMSSWLEDDRDSPETTDAISQRNESGTLKTLWRQNSRNSVTKTSNKVTMDIKKQNVNLPSIIKNTKGQTLSYSIRNGARPDMSAQVNPKQAPVLLSTTQPKKSNDRDTRPLSDFLMTDAYLRKPCSTKPRVSSHNSTGKALRKTVTVDNLKHLKKVSQKKTEHSKPNDLAFTRSFTFSMFDLPEMYKLYNTNLEKRVNSEQIRAFE